MSREYQIVKYTPEFKDQVVELQKHLWSSDSDLNRTYLEWKYEKNPYMQAARIYLVMFDGRVVGMRGLYGAKWEIGSLRRTFVVPCSGDLVVTPEHRRRGLVYKILDAIVSDPANSVYDYCFSLSASPATYVASVKSGWQSVGPLQTHVRDRNTPTVAAASVGSRMRRSGFARLIYRAKRRGLQLLRSKEQRSESPFDQIDRGPTTLESYPEIVVSAEPDSSGMAELILRLGDEARIRHVRDCEFFEWRLKNPLSAYRFVYWKRPALEGYLVLQTWLNPRRAGSVHIVDWEATTPTVAQSLLRAALHLGKFKSVRIWSGGLSALQLEILEREEFEIEERGGSALEEHDLNMHRGAILIKALGQEQSETSEYVLGCQHLLDKNNWDLRMIYSDDF